jgi:uncharacterized protein
VRRKQHKAANNNLSAEYLECVRELLDNETVRSMKQYVQHNDIDCFMHSLNVSYSSYLVCRKLGLDFRSAARGGLLHDFFLYDWHKENPVKGLHGFTHPRTAVKNANKHFTLNKREQDVIEKHMWPLTISLLPRYMETIIVNAVDKYCAFAETLNIGKNKIRQRVHCLPDLLTGMAGAV